MSLAKNLHLPGPDNFTLAALGLQATPEMVLINLATLQNQLAAGDLDPARYLADPELTTYRQFKYKKRQIEWLGGRLAAKRAYFRLTGRPQTPAAMREWPIRTDEHGKPFFLTPASDQTGLSISHSHGLALALTVRQRRCGVDLQKISPATIRVREKFCSQAEEQRLPALALPARATARAAGLTLLWAAKEALRKARGGHPLTGFIAMELTASVCPNDGSWLFTLQVNGEKHQIPTFFHEDFAVAICVI